MTTSETIGMKNKFREMRGDLTQKQMVKIINKELEASGFSGITTATWSRWETGANEPTKKCTSGYQTSLEFLSHI